MHYSKIPPHHINDAHSSEPHEVAYNQPAKKQKIVVKKYGFFASIFRPLITAVVMLGSTYAVMSLGMNFYQGWERDKEYRQSYHIDRSLVEIFQSSSIAKDKVELIIRNFDGELETRLASKSQVKAFLKRQAHAMDEAKRQSKHKLQHDLSLLLNVAFADRTVAIDNYADWFFEWKRPYVILKEAISSTSTRLIKLGEYESLRTAVERDMSDYFMANYKKQVLKPEQRQPLIEKGVEKIGRDAQADYIAAMQEQSQAVREFLLLNTRHLKTHKADEPLTRTTLDWDAQRWKNPTHLMQDRSFDGLVSVGGIAATGAVGGIILGPSINRGLSSIFQPLARRFAASMGSRIALGSGGAVAGTVVEPVGGTFVGAAIGVAIGVAADYVANKINEKFSRGKFVTANQLAIESTINQWQTSLGNNLEAGVDKWWDDAKASLVLTADNIAVPDKAPKKMQKEKELPLW